MFRDKGKPKKCYYGRNHPEPSGNRIIPGVGAVALCRSCMGIYENAARETEKKEPKPVLAMGMLKPKEKR